MNAYLFTAVATTSRLLPRKIRGTTVESFESWDTCGTAIVLADSSNAAQDSFERWLKTPPSENDPSRVEVRKIAAAQLVDRLLTESGSEPLDWTETRKQAQSQVESTPLEDFEQGYWVDVEQFWTPDERDLTIDALKEKLPEDIRSGLNWSTDKQFLFVLSVLSPLLPEPEPPDESEQREVEDPRENPDASTAELRPITLTELYSNFPQALDKEAAALIRARNSVIAAWLWRRYAADTPLATHQIRIDPWCDVIAPGA